VDIAVDPAALYSFRRDSFKHRGGLAVPLQPRRLSRWT
jgi:hypothetical protein